MENYSYNSYPESGDSSPRSRDIDFENPPPWEDSQGSQPPICYKVKFMCSYGGKIHPRPHDNQLSYIGGETKILSVDRNIKFASLFAKLVGLCDSETISFKYQLPGEDLDALISVTNDDDLEHMMHEYERLYRISPKPARLRIFIFPTLNHGLSSARSFGSDDGRSEKERFVEALNSAPIVTSPPQTALPAAPQQLPQVQVQAQAKASNVDFLFGLEKVNAMAAAAAAAAQPLAPQPIIGRVPEMEEPVYIPGQDERSVVMDPIQKHIQDLQRLRLEEQQHGIYRRKSDDNIAGGYAGGEYYKVPEKTAPPPVVTAGVPHWPDRQQIQGGGMYQANNEPPPVYMIPTPAGAYHPPMVRQMAGTPAQGYYAVPRIAADHHQQPPPPPPPPQQMYSMMPPSVPSMVPAAPPQQKAAVGYSEGYGMVRAGAGGGMGMVAEAGYAQVAYDVGAGRQVMYAAPGAAAQYQGVTAGALNPEAGGKGALKVTQTQASL